MFKTALYTPYDVTGQTVLVTGATAGIGEAIAWRFAEMGCKVIATGRRAERLQALAAAVKDRFPDSKLLPYPLDVTDMEAVKAMPENLAANHPEFAEVDILSASEYGYSVVASVAAFRFKQDWCRCFSSGPRAFSLDRLF